MKKQVVVASTDKSLGLPLIPQKWIEEVYVPKQGKVDEVWIMFEPDFGGMEEYPFHLDPDKYPKKVIILPSKETFTKEDLFEAYLVGAHSSLSFEQWFDKNY